MLLPVKPEALAVRLQQISPDQLVDPPVVLRLVNRGSLGYMELRDSIKKFGILSPILVRPSARFQGKYDVVAGMYRTYCAVKRVCH